MGRSLGCQGGLDRLCHGEDTGEQGSLPTAPDSLESTPCSAAAPLLREALTSGLTPDTRIPLGRAGTRARRGLRATSLGSKWGRPQSQSCAWDRQTGSPYTRVGQSVPQETLLEVAAECQSWPQPVTASSLQSQTPGCGLPPGSCCSSQPLLTRQTAPGPLFCGAHLEGQSIEHESLNGLSACLTPRNTIPCILIWSLGQLSNPGNPWPSTHGPT